MKVAIIGVGNMGGAVCEGLFNTVVKGPGHIILQTMPVQNTASLLYKYMPHPNN